MKREWLADPVLWISILVLSALGYFIYNVQLFVVDLFLKAEKAGVGLWHVLIVFGVLLLAWWRSKPAVVAPPPPDPPNETPENKKKREEAEKKKKEEEEKAWNDKKYWAFKILVALLIGGLVFYWSDDIIALIQSKTTSLTQPKTTTPVSVEKKWYFGWRDGKNTNSPGFSTELDSIEIRGDRLFFSFKDGGVTFEFFGKMMASGFYLGNWKKIGTKETGKWDMSRKGDNYLTGSIEDGEGASAKVYLERK
ncbi:MAG: hypothetical protein WCO84_02210 [bacterium]